MNLEKEPAYDIKKDSPIKKIHELTKSLSEYFN